VPRQAEEVDLRTRMRIEVARRVIVSDVEDMSLKRSHQVTMRLLYRAWCLTISCSWEYW